MIALCPHECFVPTSLLCAHIIALCPQVEIAKRKGYIVTDAGGDLHYVKNTSSRTANERHVHLNRPSCDCTHWRMHGQPCRHMAVVFFKKKMLGPQPRTAKATRHKFWPKWAFAKNYLDLYKNKTVARPGIYSGPFKGANPHDILGPPLQTHKKRGRPKKARYKRRGRAKSPKQVAVLLPTVTNAEYAAVMRFL